MVLTVIGWMGGCAVDVPVSNEKIYAPPPQEPTATIRGVDGLEIGYIDGHRAPREAGALQVQAGSRVLNVRMRESDLTGGGTWWKTFKFPFGAGKRYVLRPDLTDGFSVHVTEEAPLPTTIIR